MLMLWDAGISHKKGQKKAGANPGFPDLYGGLALIDNLACPDIEPSFPRPHR
jgi:hypothetical protein